MSLLHRVDEITDDIISLECHSCHTGYGAVEMLDLEYSENELRCDCGANGFIPHRRPTSKVAGRYPPGSGCPFTPLPEALMNHRAALGLTSQELLVIIALERFRRDMGQEVYPSRETIADLTGLSVDQVKRAISRLTEPARGLLRRRQPGAAQSRGRGSNRYLLDGLWNRIAELENERRQGARSERSFAGGRAPQIADGIPF